MIRLLLPLALLLTAAFWYRLEARKQDAARDFLTRKLELAEAENERLRGLVAASESERAAERNRVVRAEIERAVESIRGLRFKEPVQYEILTRAEIREVLSGKMGENMSEAEFAAAGYALARLGLLPEGFDLRRSLVDLLSEQVAAYYDQHRHKLFMFADASLENAQNRVILAHELTHALQDQHFGLARLPLEIKDNDDRALAASALVEGEATMVMGQYQMQNLSLRGLSETVGATFGQSMQQLEKAPPYLRELLVFPYLRGQEFCAALNSAGGYERISAAYAKLPTSSAQILHPQAYLAAPGEPVRELKWPSTTYDGEAAALENTLGEFGTRLQLGESGDAARAEAAAAGWRGDRYLSFPKHDAIVWKTAWSNPMEAAEFAAAERAQLVQRYGLQGAHEDGVTFRADAPRALRLVQMAEGTVLLIDAREASTADGLLGQFGGK